MSDNSKFDMYDRNKSDCYTCSDYIPLLEDSAVVTNKNNNNINKIQFPGNRREILPNRGIPENHVLVKTAGNALQAVPKSLVDSTTTSGKVKTMAVRLPENLQPGDTLWVQTPDEQQRLIEVTVPSGVFPGHTFFVEIPNQQHASQLPTIATLAVSVDDDNKNNTGTATTAAAVVQGHDIQQDLELQQEIETTEQQQQHHNENEFSSNTTTPTPAAVQVSYTDNPNIVSVKLISSNIVAPGSKVLVKFTDGRLVEAVVPQDELEFLVQVPSNDNNNTTSSSLSPPVAYIV